jgi:hypothetical protein
MLFRKEIVAGCENIMEHKNTLCRQRVSLMQQKLLALWAPTGVKPASDAPTPWIFQKIWKLKKDINLPNISTK